MSLKVYLVRILRIVAIGLLSYVLVACDTNNITNSSPIVLGASCKTVNQPIQAPGTSLDPNASNVTIAVGNLCIQSDFGFQCPYNAPNNVPMDQLVLASDRLTYSQAEIAQMGAYAAHNYGAWNSLETGAKPPPTLRWVLGGSMASIPGTYENGSAPCGTVLYLTNTGSTSLQIPQVGVQLEAHPQQNFYRYRLIDACSFVPKSQQPEGYSCIPELGGKYSCSWYTASIQLGLGTQNDVFFAVPSEYGCGTLTLAPGDQINLIFGFSLASNTPKNIIYSIKPILRVLTAQGEQTVSLSQLASTLVYASANQFSCYGLQGTTFVLEQSPVYSDHLWCM